MTASAGSGSDGRALSGRLPFFEDGELDEEQRELARQLHELAVPFATRSGFAGTDDAGHLIGAWNVLLARPGAAAGFNQWLLAEQTTTSLDAQVREVAILTVAVARRADYAIYAHVAAARTAGMAEAAIDEVLHPTAPSRTLTEPQAAAQRFADQLARGNAVDDDVYDRAVAALGEAGVVDLTHLVGVYLGTCALLGAFAVPAPPAP